MTHILLKARASNVKVNVEAAKLAQELGLDAQAQRHEKLLAEDHFTALTDDEVTLWKHHCPTSYDTSKDFSSYVFDTIPVEVLRHWKQVTGDYVFDRYEIWTTERTHNTDPLLMGVLGSRLYLLARWGAESPELLSIRQIAQQIVDKYHDFAQHNYFDHQIFPWSSKEKAILKKLHYYKVHDRVFAAAERVLGAAI